MASDPLAVLRSEILAHTGCGFEPCTTASRMVPGEGDPRGARHVRRRGARRHRGRARASVRRPRREAARRAAGRGRAGPRGRLDHQRGQGAPAEEPRPEGSGGRALHAVAGARARADRTGARRPTRASRAQALRADGEDRRGPWDGDRRPARAVPALSPGGGDVQPDAEGDAGCFSRTRGRYTPSSSSELRSSAASR